MYLSRIHFQSQPLNQHGQDVLKVLRNLETVISISTGQTLPAEEDHVVQSKAREHY